MERDQTGQLTSIRERWLLLPDRRDPRSEEEEDSKKGKTVISCASPPFSLNWVVPPTAHAHRKIFLLLFSLASSDCH